MSTTETQHPITVYRGTQHGHDYVVLARHPRLEAKAVLVIDGIYHDPSRESEPRTTATSPGVSVLEATSGSASGEPDGLAFSADEGFATTTYTVRRPDGEESLKDAEKIIVRTAWRGKGEVDIADSLGMGKRPLRPEPGSASARREEARAAHPLRFAIIAALGRAAGYLLPLLGIGALFSGLLEPIRRWIAALLEPVVSWIAEVAAPILEGLNRLREFLFGWIPEIPWPHVDLELPRLPDWLPSIPDWVFDLLVPVLVVLFVGAAAWGRVRRRSRMLENAEGSPGAGREAKVSQAAPESGKAPEGAELLRAAELHRVAELVQELMRRRGAGEVEGADAPRESAEGIVRTP